MEELSANEINFVGQQDGDVERGFTTRVAHLLNQSGQGEVGYLCRVHYGDPNDISIAVCIATSGKPNSTTLDGIASIFRDMFGTHEHLDMLFVNEEQESRLRAVCKPFSV